MGVEQTTEARPCPQGPCWGLSAPRGPAGVRPSARGRHRWPSSCTDQEADSCLLFLFNNIIGNTHLYLHKSHEHHVRGPLGEGRNLRVTLQHPQRGLLSHGHSQTPTLSKGPAQGRRGPLSLQPISVAEGWDAAPRACVAGLLLRWRGPGGPSSPTKTPLTQSPHLPPSQEGRVWRVSTHRGDRHALREAGTCRKSTGKHMESSPDPLTGSPREPVARLFVHGGPPPSAEGTPTQPRDGH